MKYRSKHAVQVEMLLQDYESTRNSDAVLILGMLQVNGAELNDRQKRLVLSLQYEAITRQRRKLQEAGKYLPTDPEVAKKRRIKGYEIQQVASSATAESLHNRIERTI